MAVEIDAMSYWIESATLPHFPAIARDERADVVVVGGGITGLTAAYLLSRAGRSVILVDRARLASSDTGHTSAHLSMVTDLSLRDLVSTFGRDHAQAVWDAGLAAIAEIDTIVTREQISCDFAWVPGYLHDAGDGSETADGLKQEAALAQDLGFDATFVEETPLVARAGVRFENQARIHPAKYLAGLVRGVVRNGGRIYERTNATEFSDSPRFVKANGHRIDCGRVVVATHTPVTGTHNIVGATVFQTKLALYSTYVVGGRVAKGSAPDALMWDTADPYHYYRLEPQREFDFVIYGGEDHKTGQADDGAARYRRLETNLRQLLPSIEITHHWSGQVIETHDGLPYIGEQTERQFAGTGYSGNGLTFGTVAAMMATDWMVGNRNPWTDLFDMRRKRLAAVWDYVKENKDYPYYLIRDRFAGVEGRSLRGIPSGQGKVIDYKGQRVAAYRGEDGEFSLRSAICTHMGCSVAWNSVEKSWDCPCHGSRFSTQGKVLAGPAESPLPEIKDL